MISVKINRTHYIEDVNADMKGQEVILGGWIEDLRKMGKMTFLTLRDATGITQIILTSDVMKSIGDITRQSVVELLVKYRIQRLGILNVKLKPMKLTSWQKLFIHYLLILLAGLKVILTTG